jgi:hypothetical protein
MEWKDEGNGIFAKEFKGFYSEIQESGDVLHQDVSVHQPSALSDLFQPMYPQKCLSKDLDPRGSRAGRGFILLTTLW